jgi:hypothetical protein
MGIIINYQDHTCGFHALSKVLALSSASKMKFQVRALIGLVNSRDEDHIFKVLSSILLVIGLWKFCNKIDLFWIFYDFLFVR